MFRKKKFSLGQHEKLKSLKKEFSDIPSWYVESIYSLFFNAGRGVLATANLECHSEILGAFQKFMESCQESVEKEMNSKEFDKKSKAKKEKPKTSKGPFENAEWM